MTTDKLALYYPYIHVRDPNWLKGTLLLFHEVRRMVPYEPEDDTPEIREFCRTWGGRQLLTCANLNAERVVVAQRRLAARIRTDSRNPEFLRRHGKEVTRRRLRSNSPGFQVNALKLGNDLVQTLRSTGLAWRPDILEPGDEFRRQYIEMSRPMGEAVMSTLAVACARAEGLDVVAEPSSGRLHQCLIEKNEAAVYDSWLHPTDQLPPPRVASGREVFEFIVRFNCDLTNVSLEDIAEMGADRELLADLMNELSNLASEIREMDNGPERRRLLRKTTKRALERWEASRGAFWREFGRESLVDESKSALQKVASDIAKGAVSGAILGPSTFLGALAGMAVGVVFYGCRRIARPSSSPYRYLTMMQKKGVTFRSDLDGRH